MEMAQQEQKHRMNWEMTYLNAEIKNQQQGQVFGLLAAILCIGGAMLLGYVGEVWPAVVLAGASMIGVVRATGNEIAGKGRPSDADARWGRHEYHYTDQKLRLATVRWGFCRRSMRFIRTPVTSAVGCTRARMC